jgi:hypothetical protein
MFINFSNHDISDPDSKTYIEEQAKAASAYGEIVFIKFPHVDPMGDEDYIQALAIENIKKIMAHIIDKAHDVVHIMGELNLVYKMVTMLKELGVTCIASTTTRIAEEDLVKGKVKKESEFEFHRFRKY